jgi:hypothetical protein
VLKGRSPNDVVRSRLTAEPKLANRRYKPPDSDALPQALQVVAHAKEVSHPDNQAIWLPIVILLSMGGSQTGSWLTRNYCSP